MQRRTLCTLGANPAVAAYASMGISRTGQEIALDNPGLAASDQRLGDRRLGELA